MAKAPNNVLATVSAAPGPSPAKAQPPSPKFAGVGAKVQGRPGESLDGMAARMHGK